jgi:hypothetical protein
MRNSRTQFYILSFFLLSAGIALTWYRHAVFDVPFLPGELRKVWSVEAKVEFTGSGEPVIASLAVPDSQTGLERIAEFTASPGYGLAYLENKNARRAEWSIRSARGNQILYYRAEFAADDQHRSPPGLSAPTVDKTLLGRGPQVTVARQILERAQARSADAFTLARELIGQFSREVQGLELLEQSHSRQFWLVALLNEAGVPARTVSVLELEDGRRRQLLSDFLIVYKGDDYQLINPETGERGDSTNILMWEYQGGSVLDVEGGSRSRVSFSIIEQELPVTEVAEQKLEASSDILDLSIHSLPLDEQALFKGILLIPMGVLVVCLLRILVGIRTAGTFMPVLIAIAFIQTSLVTGLVGFTLIVGIGLLIRGYLSQLNLLLVARISVVIVTVIILIALFSVISYQLGLAEGLKITFFPMIILSWTIERTSILWEEEGPQEVLVQVGGSLLVAILTYALMQNEWIQHLTFNFLGLQLIIMAAILSLGTYTGYRLLELHRFYSMVNRVDR